MDASSQIRFGDRILIGRTLVTIPEDLVAEIEPGDSLVGIEATGTIRRIPLAVQHLVAESVNRAVEAFVKLSQCSTDQIDEFFRIAAELLKSDETFGRIRDANQRDVADAHKRGRSTTRLVLSDKMREDMISAFDMWRDLPLEPLTREDVVEHAGWSLEQWRAPLGVIGFVFEGRPNVFADATGVLRSGNTVVFRIGSDALRTAHEIMNSVIKPATRRSGLPENAVVLLDSKEHAGGWALFSDTRLALAVARGSGSAVAELGAIARQAGVPVSLHGTGGAWILVGERANTDRLYESVKNSLDRKVCNTVNVVVVLADRAHTDIPLIVDAAHQASLARQTLPRIHCVNGAMSFVPQNQEIDVVRPNGVVREQQFSEASMDELGHEFEWEESPEFFLLVVDTLSEAVNAFNQYSPNFVVSVISEDPSELEAVWRTVDAPFFGNGFTRWVDGQFALKRPELGLSNWQQGRLFGRGGILSGDSAFTIRLRVQQEDVGLHR